jgi:H+/gluconate symporter-like permease
MSIPQRHKELETILILVIFMIVLYWINKENIFLIAAAIVALMAVLVPPAGRAIHWVWMKFAEGLGFVMSKIMLTLIYIILVIPLGWITGKLGKSSIRLKQGGKSYFTERNHTYNKEDLENPW